MAQNRREEIAGFVVTAEQMRHIEGRVFVAGMPVAALMEKVAGLIVRRIQVYHPNHSLRVGIIAGSGHNGGDALVVARELHFHGYDVLIYRPFSKLKELTSQHFQYAKNLGIPCFDDISALKDCDLIIDGLFGFGLERIITDPVATAINQLNQWSKTIISIDLPSGLHTDTGEALGIAIRATRTFCLGLWKLAFLQDQALEYIGEAELIDFDLPLTDIKAVLGDQPNIRRITPEFALSHLPLKRPPVTHKYKQGHLLLICGSHKYAGGAILTGLGARASGVGMLSMAVPESLKDILTAQLPEALIIGCPEETGAIAYLPETIELSDYSAIACGPGLTKDASSVVQSALNSTIPLILDADGLNILAQLGTIPTLSQRQAPTILTPHAGEFKRLFPDAPDPNKDRVNAVRKVSQHGAIVLLKGARTAIADHSGSIWIIPESTPALARGGSGDVLTGLMGGLVAAASTRKMPIENIVASAAWWHATSGILAAQERTELGVDAFTLTQYLISVLR
ncbi:YjeF-related protein [Crinalium epipsammum PCC 9333]|uniref:Bifunctional NAD(P)H-hydrate repair enzyme n=1 Tax=Crinalium epipsammum PCC 9333 TaxID=1173022 RepID=K9W6C3_9CYAN|nr:bifunctional ADP-dependent NAD(P)H-hydrate dehydratase/NAD(P)H-hydrate epimerase [Crinalium epipsammum]AFZ15302.1 YjeF-related protein [Crinalium epipsammum PCC 9333]